MSLIMTLLSAIVGCICVSLYFINHIYITQEIDASNSTPKLDVRILVPLLALSLLLVAYTLYEVVRLRVVLRQIAFNIDYPLIELIRKFTNLCIVFLANWCITGVAVPMFAEWHPAHFSSMTTCFASILFVNTLITLGPQCRHFSHWIPHYDDEIRKIGTISTFHGLSYLIFMIALYAATCLGLSVIALTHLNLHHVHWTDIGLYDLLTCGLCPVVALGLLIYCHYFNAMVVTFVSEISVHSVPSNSSSSVSLHHFDSLSVHSLSIHQTSYSMQSVPSWIFKPILFPSKCSFSRLWRRHMLYLENGMIMIWSLAILSGAVIFHVVDETTIRTSCTAIIVIAGGSMLVHFLTPYSIRMTMLIEADRKFRACCTLKTCLLLLNVLLIVELGHNNEGDAAADNATTSTSDDTTDVQPIWKYIFGGLAMVNILSVTVITARFDGNFWDRLNSLKYYHKFGKLLYWTYCISWMTTNCCSLYITGCAVFHSSKYSELSLSDPELWLFSVYPLVWILCAVLYHNEFVGFERDSKNRMDSMESERNGKFVSTSMRSLYYFMNLTVITSFGTMVVYGTYIWWIEREIYDPFMLGHVGCTAIVFVNGVVGLFVLDDIRNDVFLQNELAINVF